MALTKAGKEYLENRRLRIDKWKKTKPSQADKADKNIMIMFLKWL